MFVTSITPEGRFLVGCHSPSYRVANLRERAYRCDLGTGSDGAALTNAANFPAGDVTITSARSIYEIRNAFPFRGCSYIDSGWADARAVDPGKIRIHPPPAVSLKVALEGQIAPAAIKAMIRQLPISLRYTLAQTSTDPEELVWLAESCCCLVYDSNGNPSGLRYVGQGDRMRADVDDFELFETIANNPSLPDAYKEVMMLRPGVQGNSEIVGDFQHGSTEVFEYLRGNSYIPWGHYAANCAHTAVRYRIADLSATDMAGMRHLYYQRIYTVVAEHLGIGHPIRGRRLTAEELEDLRWTIVTALAGKVDVPDGFATLWGWNFGYDFSGSGYRLHASHQMIHQQYALIPQEVTGPLGESIPAFACGDLVADTVERYRQHHQSDFFADYLKALTNNLRTDGGKGEHSLVVWQDSHVVLFVPKAQVSQWELQLMVTADSPAGPIGNVIEANSAVRRSVDAGMMTAQQVLARLGATMVTSIEYSKRIGLNNGQRLLYAFLPKLPWSMGAFSEAQGRYILGHYPEDFAAACRGQLESSAKSPQCSEKN